VKLRLKMSIRRGLDFVVNGERHHHDEPVKVGHLQVWDVVDETKMDHPFHFGARDGGCMAGSFTLTTIGYAGAAWSIGQAALRAF